MNPASWCFRAMNTDVRLLVYPTCTRQAARVADLLADAEATVRATEARFSRFRATSELSLLNQSAGSWMSVSPDMAEVLELAMSLHTETGGIFDPAVLPHLERAGYSRSFETVQSSKLTLAIAESGSRTMTQLDYVRGRVRLPPGLRLDLGGLVKGWTADRIARQLAAIGPALADLGGDIAVQGTPPTDDGWVVGVERPDQSATLLTKLDVSEGGVATSGINRRNWWVGDRQMHHLIDPRTGEPAQSDLVQVVVLDDSAARADVWAKTALILGNDGCRALIARRPMMGLLLVSSDGAATATPPILAAIARTARRAV